jgi:hypothetical protein
LGELMANRIPCTYSGEAREFLYSIGVSK